MLTICTACGTQFRVSAEQLRAVHGLVRCSRCQSVFDAFETLQEEFGPPASAQQEPPPDELEALAEQLGDPETETPHSIPASLAVQPVDAENVDIQLGAADSKPTVDDLFADVWGEQPAAATDNTVSVDSESLPIEGPLSKSPELELDQTLYQHKGLPPRPQEAAKTPHQRFRINAWGVGAILLALALAAQVINASRLPLSQTAIIGPAISSLYAAIGHPLASPSAPDTWQISNTNVTSDPETPGALSITGTLENRAGFAQSWPVLRVDLTDRDGNPLRARDFTAGEYLSAGRVATWLGPGMAAPFRIDVVDPGADAVGFTVTPCLDVQGVRECGNADNGSN